jgi:hypothetical protein
VHNEELYNLYTSHNIIIWVIKSRRIRWKWHVAWIGEMRNAYNIFVQKPEGKGPLGRPRHRWEDNLRTELWKIKWEDMD